MNRWFSSNILNISKSKNYGSLYFKNIEGTKGFHEKIGKKLVVLQWLFDFKKGF